MAQYMQVKNGTPVPGTLIQLSQRRDRSPNIYWKKEQLEAHGWYPAETQYDPLLQTIDKNSPSFDGTKVTFPVTQRAAADIKESVVALWRKMLESKIRGHLDTLYPIEDRVDAALGILPAQATSDMKTAIQGYRVWGKKVMQYVRGLTTLKAIQALQINVVDKEVFTMDVNGNKTVINTTPA